MAYSFGGKEFRRKEDIRTHAQAILRSGRPPFRLNGDDLAFALDLLRNHPDYERKRGCGIAGIWVEYNRRGSTHFVVARTDHTREPFSYKDGIAAQSHPSQVKDAFRQAIAPQILAFKRRYFAENGDTDGRVLCPESLVLVTWGEVEVDHWEPWTFSVLLQEFLQERGLNLQDIPLRQSPTLEGQILADDALAQAWYAWHQHNAVLRVLSKQAHHEVSYG